MNIHEENDTPDQSGSTFLLNIKTFSEKKPNQTQKCLRTGSEFSKRGFLIIFVLY